MHNARKIAPHFNCFIIDFRLLSNDPTGSAIPYSNNQTRMSCSFHPFRTGSPHRSDVGPVDVNAYGWTVGQGIRYAVEVTNFR